ncbi:sensor histidine kinase [Alicyclobacillus contaminans]|uniref:sensor histidine kinase n=1 Tax=Alicyclobacillus contaminans TaxID=392016 RepID=UPI000401AA39|nr:ATP-binding protein [Alicyclobacillus contaminans]
MRLRTQLLIINLASLALLIGAVVYSYSKMLLNLTQAGLLTLIAVVAGIISSVAYWLMTIPITNSVNRLIHFAEQVGNGQLEEGDTQNSGPHEVRRLTQAVQRMQQRMHENFKQLELMERTRRELIANVSHDLRTPIASIQSFVEALEDGVIDDYETSRVYLKTIHREASRLSSLIDDLFELSKLEAGQQSYHPVPAHIDQIIIEVLESYSVRIHEKGLNVQVTVADDTPILFIMPDKIARVLSNLVNNAIRHAPEQSELRIEVKKLPGGNFVEIVVTDEGEGVSAENAERVFERFYRTDKSRNRDSGGAGLGLAIARSLVELHGGEIGVRVPSGKSHGSQFWFTLPVHKA